MSVNSITQKLTAICILVALVSGCGGGKPEIEFSSEKYIIDEGASVKLAWEVTPYKNTEIVSVDIDQDVGAVEPLGETEVSPTEHTRYTLTAVADDDRRASKSVKVLVSKACIENTIAIPDAAEINLAVLAGSNSVGNIIPLCDGLMYYSRLATKSLYLQNIATGEVLEQHTFASPVSTVILDRKYARLYFTLKSELKIHIMDIKSGAISSFDITLPVKSMSVNEDGILHFVDSWTNEYNQEKSSVYSYDPVSNTVDTLITDIGSNGTLGNLIHNPEADEYAFTIRNSSISMRFKKAVIKVPDNYTETPLTRYFSTQEEMSVPSSSFGRKNISPDFTSFTMIKLVDGMETLSVMDMATFTERYSKPLEGTTTEYSPIVYSPDGKFIAVGGLSQISIHSSTDPEFNQYIDITDSNCRYPNQLSQLSYATNGDYIYGVQFCGDGYNVFYRRINTSTSGEAVNIAPVALARSIQEAEINSVVELNGSYSFDDNGDTLHYSWSVKSRPAASVAEIINPDQAMASFTPDIGGIYRFELVVNDGIIDSDPTELRITAFTMPSAAPVVDTILPSEVSPGTLVTVLGSGFDQATVTLNNNYVVTLEKSDTSIRFTAPNLLPGIYDLVVENRLGSHVNSVMFKADQSADPDMQITISGLPPGTQITLHDTITGEDHSLSENGGYVLVTDVAMGSNYEVTLLDQPEGYHCSGTNLKGVTATNSIASIKIDCAPAIEIPEAMEYAIRGELRDVGVGVYHVCYIDGYGTHCLGNAPDYGSMPAAGCEFDPVDPCPAAIDMLEVALPPDMGHPNNIDVGNNQACAVEGGITYCWLGYTFNEYLRLGSTTGAQQVTEVISNEYEICSVGVNGTLCRYSYYPAFTWENPIDVDINSDTRCVLYGGVVRCDGDFFNVNTTFFGGKKLALNKDSTKVCMQTADGLQCLHFGGATSQVLVPDIQDIGFVDDKICALTSTDLRCWSSLSSTFESTEFENPVRLWTEDNNYCVETQSHLICNGTVSATIEKL